VNEAETAKSSLGHNVTGRNTSDDYVLYDGACPACARYVAATGLAERPDDVALIDARTHPELVAEHAAARPVD